MFEAVNHPVSKLRRESFATIAVRHCERGKVRMLSGEEVRRLREISDGSDPKLAGQKGRYKKRVRAAEAKEHQRDPQTPNAEQATGLTRFGTHHSVLM
jgi:hypothetical protein